MEEGSGCCWVVNERWINDEEGATTSRGRPKGEGDNEAWAVRWACSRGI